MPDTFTDFLSGSSGGKGFSSSLAKRLVPGAQRSYLTPSRHMRKSAQGTAMTGASKTLDRALSLLVDIVADGGARPVVDIAADRGIPASTAHRLTAAFARHGLLARERRGHCQPGVALSRLASTADMRNILENVGRSVLTQYARRFRRVMHIGIFEGEMLTYLVRGGPQHDLVITSDGIQLEAYCSSMGKVLLAHMPAAERDRYLNEYPFIKLTSQTIIDPVELAGQVERAAVDGYAVNDREFHDEICSVAIPLIIGERSRFVAAMSMLIPNRRMTDANIAEAVRKLHVVREALLHRLEPLAD